MSQPKYSIETDCLYGVECSDEGRWLCYDTFAAEGNTLDELLENCSGFKMDQDGGTGPDVHYDDLPVKLQAILSTAILKAYLKQGGRAA